MKPVAHCLKLAVLAAAFAVSAHAQTPGGIQADPCSGVLPIPQSLIDSARARFAAPGSPAPAAVPAADLAAYRAMETQQRANDWPNLCRFRADNAALVQKPASERRVVFMGDSITQNWLLSDPAYFTAGIVNRGISGQTTPQMLGRFRADVIALKPKVVHILAGVNDIAGNTGPTTLENIENNIASMVEIARANGVGVVLSSALPADSFGWMPGAKPASDIQAYNAWLKAYAAQEKIVYADYHTPMATPEGALKPAYTFDGVHPNNAGYAVMAPIAQAALKKAGLK